MALRARKGPLAAGLILILIGAGFLLENWRPFSFWSLLAKCWPVILILIGLNKLYGYFTWQEPSPVQVPLVPVSESKE
jgi:LiaI-LiaF-like transmembrane region